MISASPRYYLMAIVYTKYFARIHLVRYLIKESTMALLSSDGSI